MEKLYNEGDECARLDVIKYTTCINALAKKGKCAEAQSLLNKMRVDFMHGNDKAQPDSKVFETVIACWCAHTAVCGHGKKGAAQAEDMLYQMWQLHSTGKFATIRPTCSIYKRVIIAMKKSKQPERAEVLLDEACSLYSKGQLDEAPDEQMFQTVINSWKNSPSYQKMAHCSELEIKMRRFCKEKDRPSGFHY